MDWASAHGSCTQRPQAGGGREAAKEDGGGGDGNPAEREEEEGEAARPSGVGEGPRAEHLHGTRVYAYSYVS